MCDVICLFKKKRIFMAWQKRKEYYTRNDFPHTFNQATIFLIKILPRKGGHMLYYHLNIIHLYLK